MNFYLLLILVFLLGSYLLALIADWLNLRHVQPELPQEFSDVWDAAQYRQSQAYLRENTRFSMVHSTVMTILLLGFLLAGGFGSLDRMARAFGQGPILTGLIFTAFLGLLSTLVNLPFQAYDTFAIETRYGFNRTTVRTFVLDLVKGALLALVIGGPILALMLWFFQAVGGWAWCYAWLALALIQGFLVLVSPVLILPLFNRFTPLPEGELRTALETYARTQDFKMRGIFTMDGSKRSSKSNAFFTGFGRFRRIVLFDTLIQKHSVPELVAVLAHEMGHYRKKHVTAALGLSFLTSGMVFALLGLFIHNPVLTQACRFEHHSLYAGMVVFGFLYTPLEELLGILLNALSRRHEYAADAYAAATTGTPAAMIAALKKLSRDSLANLSPHPLKVWLEYSHPPILARIRALQQPAVSLR